MSCNSIDELPDSVRTNLPQHGREIYRQAFNNTWEQYRNPRDRRGDESREEASHLVAWSASKQEYEKDRRQGAGTASNPVTRNHFRYSVRSLRKETVSRCVEHDMHGS